MSSAPAAATAAQETSPLKARLTLPWKAGLSRPLLEAGGSLHLDAPLAAEVSRHLVWEERLPHMCEVAVSDATGELQAKLSQAQMQAELNSQESGGIPAWALPVAGMAGAVLGFMAGFIFSARAR